MVEHFAQATGPVPSNLPSQLTSFVGRERELDELRPALPEARLLTLTGTGGCGKTRLALRLAADALEHFPDGVWWLELAPYAEPELVGRELASALGIRPLPGQTYLEAAQAHLAGRRTLVVFDNCEHLLEASAEAAQILLQGCPKTSVLATSRIALGIQGEAAWRVPPLTLPEAGGDLTRSDAVRLFLERSGKHRPTFVISETNAPLVTEICRALDGIPLAIELAAARIRMLSVEQIAARLTDRFRLLTDGPDTGPDRQQTLRASVDWSHDLLEPDEQMLLRRLGVFVGGFTLEAAEEVCSGHDLDGPNVLDLLTSLIDSSLVSVEEDGERIRYRLLETVRQYAVEHLDDAETGALRDRHRDFYLAFAERAERELLTPRQQDLLTLLDADAANLQAAIGWAAETEPDKALRLCAALVFWWRLRGFFSVAQQSFDRALSAAGTEPTPLRARVLWASALHSTFAADYQAAARTGQEALEMAEEVGDDSTLARTLDVLGTVQLPSDPVGARAGLERARELARASGDDWGLANATLTLAFSYLRCDAYEELERVLEDIFPLIDRIGYREWLSWYWCGRSWAALFRADIESFRERVGQAFPAPGELGEPVSEGTAVAFIALLEVSQGRAEAARARLEQSRERLIATGAAFALPFTEIVLAAAQSSLGEVDRARADLEAVVKSGADFGLFLAWASVQLADLLRVAGDATGAAGRARDARELAERVQNPIVVASANEVLGGLAIAGKEWSEAESLLHDALGLRVERQIWLHVPQTLDALAEVAAGLESYVESARILGAAERGRNDRGLVRWPPDEPRLNELERTLRDALGGEAFEAALAGGAALPLAEAVAWMRRARGSRKRPSGGWESLTPTEVEVVRLAAEGLTNPQIGERMFISRATVKTHLTHIYSKLDVKNRSELAAKAASRSSPLAPQDHPPG